METFDEINFQPYVDAVKRKKISWNIFVKLMKDFFYSDINRLKHINATLLIELTMTYSDMDRLKYINEIFIKEFKNLIQNEDNTIEMIESEELEKFQNSSLDDHNLKKEIRSEAFYDSVIQIENEELEDF